ncbi:unnamed protein product, partial [Hymenolepis diminuta]
LPSIYVKTLYSIENGKGTITTIKASELSQDIDRLNGTCYQILQTTTVEANKTDSINVIYKNRTNDCYFCYELIARSENVIQYRRSQCQPVLAGHRATEICDLITGVEL